MSVIKKDNIKVALKFRPILPGDTNQEKLWVTNTGKLTSSDKKYKIMFDKIYNETATTEAIYAELGRPVISKALQGFNGTIFAYGQTNSGKTHTMMGDTNSPGVIVLAIRNLFKSMEDFKDRVFDVKVGYIEIYNEKIYDLLDDRKDGLFPYDSHGQTIVNQKEFTAATESEVLQYLEKGNTSKHMGANSSNERSSRSHTIFRITIQSKSTKVFDKRFAYVYLVDLAGSEKPDKKKQSFGEGLHINRSLLSLGKIVRQLGKKTAATTHSNFRESKLTRILSPALRGNSLVSVICTVSPNVLEETYHTVCFAQNIKKVKVYPAINVTDKARSLLKNIGLAASPGPSGITKMPVESVDQTVAQLAKEKQEMEKIITDLKCQLAVKSFKFEEIHKSREELFKQKVEACEALKAQLLEAENKIIRTTYENANIFNEYQIEVKEKDKNIQEKDQKIQEKDKKIAEMSRIINEFSTHYDQLFNTTQRNHKKRLQKKDETIAQLQEKIRDLRNQRNQIEDQIEEAFVNRAEDRLEEMGATLMMDAQYQATVSQAIQRYQHIIEHQRTVISDRDARLDALHNQLDSIQKTSHSEAANLATQSVTRATTPRNSMLALPSTANLSCMTVESNMSPGTFGRVAASSTTIAAASAMLTAQPSTLLDDSNSHFARVLNDHTDEIFKLKQLLQQKDEKISNLTNQIGCLTNSSDYGSAPQSFDDHSNAYRVLEDRVEGLEKMLREERKKQEEMLNLMSNDEIVIPDEPNPSEEMQELKSIINTVLLEINHLQLNKRNNVNIERFVHIECKKLFVKLSKTLGQLEFHSRTLPSYEPESPSSSLTSSASNFLDGMGSQVMRQSTCSECDETFDQHRSLRRHKRSKHRTDPY